jgi:hypothetical protein
MVNFFVKNSKAYQKLNTFYKGRKLKMPQGATIKIKCIKSKALGKFFNPHKKV